MNLEVFNSVSFNGVDDVEPDLKAVRRRSRSPDGSCSPQNSGIAVLSGNVVPKASIKAARLNCRIALGAIVPGLSRTKVSKTPKSPVRSVAGCLEGALAVRGVFRHHAGFARAGWHGWPPLGAGLLACYVFMLREAVTPLCCWPSPELTRTATVSLIGSGNSRLCCE